jgi:hypothetical protein
MRYTLGIRASAATLLALAASGVAFAQSGGLLGPGSSDPSRNPPNGGILSLGFPPPADKTSVKRGCKGCGEIGKGPYRHHISSTSPIR